MTEFLAATEAHGLRRRGQVSVVSRGSLRSDRRAAALAAGAGPAGCACSPGSGSSWTGPCCSRGRRSRVCSPVRTWVASGSRRSTGGGGGPNLRRISGREAEQQDQLLGHRPRGPVGPQGQRPRGPAQPGPPHPDGEPLIESWRARPWGGAAAGPRVGHRGAVAQLKAQGLDEPEDDGFERVGRPAARVGRCQHRRRLGRPPPRRRRPRRACPASMAVRRSGCRACTKVPRITSARR
jgi:hypothetical protein